MKKEMEKQAMLPVGVSDFHKLVTHRNAQDVGYLFIDKSMAIREFINAGDEVSLITRPRRFGKTLACSMLQHFFAKEVNGKATKGLFDNLAIAKYPEEMKLQGAYSVIFLTLKNIKGINYNKAF